jgi:hypothetical protein
VLLLVLILVLVAFGLLVVALLTGNVLCAWLSVAVSVAAAVVLVVDWLQRRSALKAGAAAGAQPASTLLAPRPVADLDPVTEVLPVVPHGSGIDGEDVGGADFGEGDTSGGRSSEADTQYQPRPDGQQTVILSAIQPSGSAARPSGAEGPTTSSGGPSSQSVTESRADSSSDADADSVVEPRPSDAESTVAVDIRKGTDKSDAGLSGRDADATVIHKAGPPSDADESTIGSGAAGGAAAAALAAASASSRGENGSLAGRSADDTIDGSAGDGPSSRGQDSTISGASAPAVEGPSLDKRTPSLDKRTAPDPFSDLNGAGSRPSEGSVFTDAKTADSQAAASAQSALASADLPAAASGAAAERATTKKASAERAGDANASAGGPGEQSARSTFGGPVSSGHELFDPVDRSAAASTPPPPPPPPAESAESTAVMSAAGSSQAFDDDDPPEEPLDHAAANIVAGLDDEVLVIDEQPRYHVDTCRAVATQPSIPLPAREAVELGFTPCGWCTPDAVLAERHQASARP